MEGEESVSVCVEVKNATPDECLANFTFNINFSTMQVVHTSKYVSSYPFSLKFFVSTSDYIAKTTVLTFAPCEVVQCLSVSLRDDCLLERPETFNITLTLPPVERRIRLDPGNGIISITDNDGKCITL